VAANALYYGDNLDVLQRYVKDATVDLVYLDPPFNSNANTTRSCLPTPTGHSQPLRSKRSETHGIGTRPPLKPFKRW